MGQAEDLSCCTAYAVSLWLNSRSVRRTLSVSAIDLQVNSEMRRRPAVAVHVMAHVYEELRRCCVRR